MALIGKIRKNFWFVLLLLGLALAAFIVMDMTSASNQGGLGPKQTIGEVAGKKIDYRDFQKAEQALYGNSEDSYAGKNSTWNYLIEKSIIDSQAEEIGLTVTTEELKELQFGTNLSPIVQNYYRNPQTGQVDRQALLNTKQAIEEGGQLNPDFEMRWSEIQKQIRKTAKQDKLSNLVSKSLYTPTFVAEKVGSNKNTTVNFDYVKIPFDKVDDSEVEVTESDIANYIKENAYLYTNDEETRTLEYGVFDVIATSDDSMSIKNELAEIANTFREKPIGTEDSLYTINNEGYYSPFYTAKEDITGDLENNVESMEVGDVYGPYLDQGAYFIAKLIDKAMIPDSVEASHILRSATEGDEASFTAASEYIDSLQTVLKSGRGDFAELAKEHSEDPGSGAKGGELGTFTQGRMVPAFNDAVFVGSREGGLYKVRTQFGVHLIKVSRKVFEKDGPKYKLALIRSAIIPSDETQNRVYEVADEVVSTNRTLESLQNALAEKDITLQKATAVKKNDYLFASLGGGEVSREIIRWAFEEDTEKNDVSPSIYTYNDPVNFYNNKYVLVGLKSVNPAGLASASDKKDELEVVVRNEKKGEVLKGKISGNDLFAIASNYGSSVETINDAALAASGITGLGNEPKVLAKAHSLNEGEVSSPIIGNTGVYVVKTTAKKAGGSNANVLAERKTLNNLNRGRVGFSLMNALKEKFKPEDNRYTYF